MGKKSRNRRNKQNEEEDILKGVDIVEEDPNDDNIEVEGDWEAEGEEEEYDIRDEDFEDDGDDDEFDDEEMASEDQEEDEVEDSGDMEVEEDDEEEEERGNGDIFEFEDDKGKVDQYKAEDYSDDEDDKKKEQKADEVKKSIQKRKSLVNKYLAAIRCKDKRIQMVFKRKIEVKKMRNKLRRENRKKNLKAPEQIVKPITIEDKRETDKTFIFSKDHELDEEEACDEFADFFDQNRETKIVLTTNIRPHAESFKIIKELKDAMPNIYYYPRKEFNLTQICKECSKKGFSHVVVVRERQKKPYQLMMICLPYGPTLVFKLTSIKLRKTLNNFGRATGHYPELILKNFNTSLGRRVGRFIASMFPQNPEFRARTVVSFLNMRDFIFFRHHRYIFKDNGTVCRLQEIGPRFTLKLQKVMKGIYEKFQQYEWKGRNDMYVSRKRVYL